MRIRVEGNQAIPEGTLRRTQKFRSQGLPGSSGVMFGLWGNYYLEEWEWISSGEKKQVDLKREKTTARKSKLFKRRQSLTRPTFATEKSPVKGTRKRGDLRACRKSGQGF